jgi:hypothetical protein
MPNPKTSQNLRGLPSTFVITKTHCGSRCVNCDPEEYGYETPTSFLHQCASGEAVNGDGRTQEVIYSPTQVSRAIHLIRNPLHNIIARFHLEHHHNTDDSNNTTWLQNHPKNATGFQRWCHDNDHLYLDEEKEFFLSYKQLPPTVLDAPCHGEFYRYAQWHTLLHDSLDVLDNTIPVLTVYYEDYEESKYNLTVHSILSFLQLDVAHDKRGNVKWQPFRSSDSHYSDHYTPEQNHNIKTLMESVSSKKAWDQIKHYFEEE